VIKIQQEIRGNIFVFFLHIIVLEKASNAGIIDFTENNISAYKLSPSIDLWIILKLPYSLNQCSISA